MIAGERDPRVLADMAKGKMRRKIPELAQALTGHFDAHHAQLARSILCTGSTWSRPPSPSSTRSIAAACAAVGAPARPVADHARGRAAGRPGDHRRDRRRTCPGSPPPAHLASWAGLAPAIHESAGKRSPAGTPARQQVAVRDAGRGRRVGRPDARQELPRRTSTPIDQRRGMQRPRSPSRTRCWSRIGCSAMSPPRPRRGLARPPKGRSPHPPARRPARTTRPHRRPPTT